jgi:putative transposase
MLEESFGVKERRACRVVGQHRSTQRLEVVLPADDEQELRRWLVAFAKDHRVGAGSSLISTVRPQRLEGLKVAYRKRKRSLPGLGAHAGAMSPNAIWAMEFQFDETRDGKLLNVQDIFTRECLA